MRGSRSERSCVTSTACASRRVHLAARPSSSPSTARRSASCSSEPIRVRLRPRHLRQPRGRVAPMRVHANVLRRARLGRRAVHVCVVALEEAVGHRPLDKLVTEGEEGDALVDVAPHDWVVRKWTACRCVRGGMRECPHPSVPSRQRDEALAVSTHAALPRTRLFWPGIVRGSVPT